jgi:plastocyanin
MPLARAETVEVRVFDFEFSAAPVGEPILDPTINVGDTIRWVWEEGLHNVISVVGIAESWASPLSSQVGFTFEHTFSQEGVFPYYCKVHGFDNGDGTAGGMAGIITVVPEPTVGLLAGAVAAIGLIRRKRV